MHLIDKLWNYTNADLYKLEITHKGVIHVD